MHKIASLQIAGLEMTDHSEAASTAGSDPTPGPTKDWWTEAVNAYLPSVYRFVRARAPADAVDDLVQETFVAAAQSLGQFDPDRGVIWGWLCGIARRKIAAFYRRTNRSAALAEARSGLHAEKDLIAEAVDRETLLPPEICQRFEFCKLAGAALSSLDPAQREVLLARYEEDLSLEEIGRRIDRSRSATNSLLHRARQALRRAFLDLLHDDTELEDIL